MALPVRFADDNRGILRIDANEQIAKAEYDEHLPDGRQTKHDCGLLVRVRHPLNHNKTILYLAGCETFGVKIAAESLRPEAMPQILG
jgi:hypothetical protein